MSDATLTEAVTAFLELAMKHPEKEPRTQREGRDNEYLILGFNRAQETLRTVLEQAGHSDLAAVRTEYQRQPIMLGDRKVWVVA